MSNWKKIISDDKTLRSIYLKRKKPYKEKRISLTEKEQYFKKKWAEFKQYKNGNLLIRRDKTHGVMFEDRMWSLFYKMGFTCLNEDESFVLAYSKENQNLTQQIDVFAMDDETIIMVECKSTEKIKASNFKTDLEAYYGKIKGLRTTIREKYPNRKICFIWATNNYELGEQDKSRLSDFNFIFFNETTLTYFENLADHLGSASKYQLLGYLFPNQKIPGMNIVVPAIKGTMGGHTYYSFTMTPLELLKFSYVLHRNNANNEMMPTYQRLIKKSRLNKIRDFINNKGYFPNSVIINMNEEGKFNPVSNKSIYGSKSRLGFLEIPKKYRAAYVIDGQHRIYGYSDSEYAGKHTIPVIAFVKLRKDEQVKMFMDINENQKSVPRILKNTLIKDLYLESRNYNEVRVAQSLIVADKLGTIKISPLYNRVLIGENKKTDTTSITLENLRLALQKKSDFFTSFTKNNIPICLGSFDFDDTEKTVNSLVKFLIKCLNLIKEYNEEEWSKGTKEGFIATNNTIMAIIYMINDFVSFTELRAPIDGLDKIYSSIENKLFALCQVLETLSAEKRQEFKKLYGAGGPNLIHKELGYQVSLIEPEYSPEWLQKYIEDNKQNNIEESRDNLIILKNRYINDIKKSKPESISFIEFVNEKTFLEINNEIGKERLEAEKRSEDFHGDEWSVLSFNLLDKIINNKSNWSSLFKDLYGKHPVINGYKTREIMQVLDKLERKVLSDTSLSLEESKWVSMLVELI